jgi:hypothetical protein
MLVKLTCPVCDRQGIERDICPNCETDISVVRMLAELPRKRLEFPLWLVGCIAVFCLLLGVSLAMAFDLSSSENQLRNILNNLH